ncbi:MAG: hypothetical protein AMJ43_06700 [Coxiella sp. DG_40]|nr:MAG: hypothetical protein AMJ43_06700 [Coxiella sp. DG_40]
MGKWFKNVLTLIILAFLIWYLAGHWQQLKVLLKLSSKQLAVMYLLCFLLNSINARVVQQLVSAMNTETGYWDMVRLQNAAVLLNYVPMKFGTIFRANYLKRHYGLAYSRFATSFLYITFLLTATAATVGLIILLTVYGLGGYSSKILATVFVTAIIGSLLFLFTPVPIPAGRGQLSSALRNFLTGRNQISKSWKTICICVVLSTVNFILTGVRLSIVYHSMGKGIHPAGYLVLGALGFVTLFIALTPGSLGIRELVLGAGATALGVPLQVGIFAAMIDRAIAISYAFVVGGSCAIWLWRASPADFKEKQNDSSGPEDNL